MKKSDETDKTEQPTDQKVKPDTQSKRIDRLIFQQDIASGAIKQQALVPSPCQKGDIYYGGDGVNFKRVGIGLSNQVLTVISGVPTWKYLLTTGIASARPTSGTFAGQQFFSTDTWVLSIWTGAAWKTTTLS